MTAPTVVKVSDVQMNERQNRLKSFDGKWQESYHVSVDHLVDAGFYYLGPKDRVKCYYCKKTLKKWTENDDPVVEHKRLSKDCKFYEKIVSSSKDMTKQPNRLQSYPSGWSSDNTVSPEFLSSVGLYFYDAGPPCKLKCAFCSFTVDHLRSIQLLLKQHLDVSPYCKFAKDIESHLNNSQIETVEHEPMDVDNKTVTPKINYNARLASFKTCEHLPISKITLAKNYFIYQKQQNNLKCTKCQQEFNRQSIEKLKLECPHDKPIQNNESHCDKLENTLDGSRERVQADCSGVLEDPPRTGSLTFDDVQMEVEKNRKLTFPKNFDDCFPVRMEDLVRAGFYYVGPRDRVKCFSCKKIIKKWERNDNVESEHFKLSPFCEYINKIMDKTQ